MGLYGLFISNSNNELSADVDRALKGSSLFGMFAMKVNLFAILIRVELNRGWFDLLYLVIRIGLLEIVSKSAIASNCIANWHGREIRRPSIRVSHAFVSNTHSSPSKWCWILTQIVIVGEAKMDENKFSG
ncbi:hypothetical protein V6N11_025409 [Hibiscus sabdariffa]